MLLNKRYIPPPKSDASCQLCQDLNLSSPSIRNILGIRLQDLPETAHSGCLPCRILLESVADLMAPLKGFPPLPDEEVIGITLFSGTLDGSKPQDSCTLPLTIQVQTEHATVTQLEMYTLNGQPSCWPTVGPARQIAQDASSDNCVSICSAWISECLTRHKDCRKQAKSPLPDRVVYVGNDREPYLYINTHENTGKYAALSHCWGGQVALQTKSETLETFKQKIPIEKFPKTFRDAIVICRRLGIDYLWIDSLCIIQNSKDDWDIQASKMREVYSNCFVTIAADCAGDSQQGFLTGRRPEISVKEFECPGMGTESSTAYVRKKGYRAEANFNYHIRKPESHSTLSSRGWILQESVLAPRILHFTAEELTWECSSISMCECQVYSHSVSRETSIKLALKDVTAHGQWETLVTNFTSRNLTYASDRLPAISGLASQLQRSLQAEYWAGFWSDTFPQCLLWWVLDRHNDNRGTRSKSKRILPLQAPTWSWASVTGRVTFSRRDSTFESALGNVEVTCIPSSSNKYGALSKAKIKTRCMLTPIRMNERPSRREDVREFEVVIRTTGEDANKQKLEGQFNPDVFGDGYEAHAEESYFLLSVGRNTLGGLIVLRPSETCLDQYERVGLFWYRGSLDHILELSETREIILA